MTTLLLGDDRFDGELVEIEGETHRHLFRARRLAPGDSLRVVDGRGGARWGRVAAVERFRARVELAAPAPVNEPSLRLDLLVAAPRSERASWLVEKTTELGIHRIRFVVSQRSPRRYGEATLARLDRVARAALEQCERSWLPEISANHDWSEIGGLLEVGQRLLLDAAGPESRWPPASGRSASLIVGPEGGFTADERQELLDLGCALRSLGPRVLRVETAAAVGAAGLLLRPFEC